MASPIRRPTEVIHKFADEALQDPSSGHTRRVKPEARDQLLKRNIEELPTILSSPTTAHSILRDGVKAGRLVRVIPGKYVASSALPDSQLPRYAQARVWARLKLAAGISKLLEQEVLSHSSAAELWGFPWFGYDTRVHSIRVGTNPRARAGFARHKVNLSDDDIRVVDGIAVTELERTAIDQAMNLPLGLGLAALDFALARGIDRSRLESLAQHRTGHGHAIVRNLIPHAISNSESVGESNCRYWVLKAGVRDVETQVWIDTELGPFRVDMLIRKVKLIVEYDGEIKYQKHQNALYQEKQREDALRAAGWEVIRVTKQHLAHPEKFVASLRRRLTSLGYWVQ